MRLCIVVAIALPVVFAALKIPELQRDVEPRFFGTQSSCEAACLIRNGGCDLNAHCSCDSLGALECTCHPGYEGNGALCANYEQPCRDHSNCWPASLYCHHNRGSHSDCANHEPGICLVNACVTNPPNCAAMHMGANYVCYPVGNEQTECRPAHTCGLCSACECCGAGGVCLPLGSGNCRDRADGRCVSCDGRGDRCNLYGDCMCGIGGACNVNQSCAGGRCCQGFGIACEFDADCCGHNICKHGKCVKPIRATVDEVSSNQDVSGNFVDLTIITSPGGCTDPVVKLSYQGNSKAVTASCDDAATSPAVGCEHCIVRQPCTTPDSCSWTLIIQVVCPSNHLQDSLPFNYPTKTTNAPPTIPTLSITNDGGPSDDIDLTLEGLGGNCVHWHFVVYFYDTGTMMRTGEIPIVSCTSGESSWSTTMEDTCTITGPCGGSLCNWNLQVGLICDSDSTLTIYSDPQATSSGACYSCDALVERDDGEVLPLRNIKVGDRLASFDPLTQSVQYSPFYAWLTKDSRPRWAVALHYSIPHSLLALGFALPLSSACAVEDSDARSATSGSSSSYTCKLHLTQTHPVWAMQGHALFSEESISAALRMPFATATTATVTDIASAAAAWKRAQASWMAEAGYVEPRHLIAGVHYLLSRLSHPMLGDLIVPLRLVSRKPVYVIHGTCSPGISSGTLLVDGVATSIYGNPRGKTHEQIHASYAPLRAFYEWVPLNQYYPFKAFNSMDGWHWFNRARVLMRDLLSDADTTDAFVDFTVPQHAAWADRQTVSWSEAFCMTWLRPMVQLVPSWASFFAK